MTKTTVLVALLALTACGGKTLLLDREPDFMVGNLEVHVVTSEVPWMLQNKDATAVRFAAMVQRAADHLGVSAASIPYGSQFIIVDKDEDICHGSPACWTVEDGDFEHPEGKRWVIKEKSNAVGIGDPVTCPERFGLMHEVSHGWLPSNPDNWTHDADDLWRGINWEWMMQLNYAIEKYDDC